MTTAESLEITRLLRSPSPQIPSEGRLLPEGLAVNNAIFNFSYHFFKEVAGDMREKWGYEKDLDW